MNDKLLYIVHCVDTEGPLYESLEETFKRVRNTFEIDLEPTNENMAKLRDGRGVAPEIRDQVMEYVSPERLAYNSDWGMVDNMLDDMMSRQWRGQFIDDFGNPYSFTWFILDFVGFSLNTRRRELGYHALFDHYRNKIEEHDSTMDELQWHFHPVSFSGEIHKTSNSFTYTNEHYQVLSRRIIDRQWFPCAYRPGAHCERPDINLFLEQWIPFDPANQGVNSEKLKQLDMQKDVGAGRFGDWSRATEEWEIYHPDFYDYQKKGNMRRHIARCLNLNSRLRAIDKDEVVQAFKRADSGKKTLMAYANHDEREMREDIANLYQLIRKVQKEFPEVKIKNSTVTRAFREVLGLREESPILFDVSFRGNLIDIYTDKECFGCQPYFCFKTMAGEYIHDNLDYHGGTHWSYTFDGETVPMNNVEKIGFAANDSYGNSSVAVADPESSAIENTFHTRSATE